MPEKPTNEGSDPTPGSATAGSLSEVAAAFDQGGATHVTPRWLGKRISRFRLLALLGQGSWGRVFEAEDKALKRRVALKVLRAKGRGDERETAAKVLHEARAVAGLEHPNIAQVYEVGEAHGLLFIAMELQPGGTLKEAVQASGPLEIDCACRLCADAAEALHYAHQHGVLHRDIKPGNLMLSRTGTCKVVDFGLAQIDDPSNPDPSNRTAGTPHYVAPEVVCNNPASPRADLYSLGSTLYFLLAGRKPFEHLTDPANRNGVDERTAVLRAQMDVPITPVTQYRPDVPVGLANLLEQALSKDPSQRPKDLGVFAKALRSFAAMPATASGSVELPPPPPPPPAMTQPRRARKKQSPVPMIVGVAGGIVVVGGLIAGGLMLGGNDDTPTVAANSQPSADPAPALHDEPQPETPPGEEPEQPEPRPNPRPILPDVLIPETQTDDPPVESDDDAFAPGDKAELLAADGQRVTVVGDVSFARLSGSGKVFTVGFRGVEIRDGFTLVWFPRDFDAMANAFGGTHGEGIFKQRIRVTGTVSTYRNNPQIVIDNPDQIEVIE